MVAEWSLYLFSHDPSKLRHLQNILWPDAGLRLQEEEALLLCIPYTFISLYYKLTFAKADYIFVQLRALSQQTMTKRYSQHQDMGLRKG